MSNGTSSTGGAATEPVIESERRSPMMPPETGSTDQYQPERGSENRRSPRSGLPVRTPSGVTPTEPIRLKRWAESRLSKPRSLFSR